jgi:hypothetical protein
LKVEEVKICKTPWPESGTDENVIDFRVSLIAMKMVLNGLIDSFSFAKMLEYKIGGISTNESHEYGDKNDSDISDSNPLQGENQDTAANHAVEETDNGLEVVDVFGHGREKDLNK